jgi:Leucine-rich repeat (LRR) protein
MGLQFLNSWIGDLSGLEELSLAGNHLTFLPDAFGALSALDTIDLDDNDLRTVCTWHKSNHQQSSKSLNQ